MANLDDITKKIAKLNKNLDGITDDLVSATDDYQREYERLLRNKTFDLKDGNLKPTQANFNKAQSMQPMSKLGFTKINNAHIQQYNGAAKGQLAFNASIGIQPDIGFQDVSIVKQLKRIDFSVFQTEAHLLDERIKRELVNAIALEMPYQQTVDNLSASLLGAGDKAGTLSGFSNTYMRTALFSMTKAVDQEIYDDFGGGEPTSLYLYAGPADSSTRDFCLAHVTKVYSRAKIEEFPAQNGSGLNGFASPGGWNCRHRMVLTTRADATEAGYTIIE